VQKEIKNLPRAKRVEAHHAKTLYKLQSLFVPPYLFFMYSHKNIIKQKMIFRVYDLKVILRK